VRFRSDSPGTELCAFAVRAAAAERLRLPAAGRCLREAGVRQCSLPCVLGGNVRAAGRCDDSAVGGLFRCLPRPYRHSRAPGGQGVSLGHRGRPSSARPTVRPARCDAQLTGFLQRLDQLRLAHGRAAVDILGPRFLHELSAGLFPAAGGGAGAGHAALGGHGPLCRLLAVIGLGLRALGASRSAGAFTAAGLLVDRRPGAGFGFLFGNAPGLVALLDVLGLALLLVGVLVFTATGHCRHSTGTHLLGAVRCATVLPFGRAGREPLASVGFQNQQDPPFQQRTPPWTSTPTSPAKAWRTFAPASCTSSPTPPARTSIPPAPTTGSRPPPWRPVTTSSTAGKTPPCRSTAARRSVSTTCHWNSSSAACWSTIRATWACWIPRARRCRDWAWISTRSGNWSRTPPSATAASAGWPPVSWKAWLPWAWPPTATVSATNTGCSARC